MGFWGEEGHEKYQEPWSIPRPGGSGVWEKRQVHLRGQGAQQDDENEEQGSFVIGRGPARSTGELGTP